MNKQKGLPKSTILGSVDDKETEHEVKSSGAYQSHYKHQNKQKDDLPYLKKRDFLRLMKRIATQPNIQATEDNSIVTVPTEGSIQDLGLSKIKGDILKAIEHESVLYAADISHILETSGKNNDTSRKLKEICRNILARLAALQRAIKNGDLSIPKRKEAQQPSRKGNQQDLLYHLLHESFQVSTDGEGDNDPQHTKEIVDSLPFETPGLPTSVPSYLMKLEDKTSKEILSKVLPKEDDFVNFNKAPLHKLSWREKCEEVIYVYTYIHSLHVSYCTL